MKRYFILFLIIVGIYLAVGNTSIKARGLNYSATENNLCITSSNGQFGYRWANYNRDGNLNFLIVGVEDDTPHGPNTNPLNQTYQETTMEFSVPEKNDVRIELVNTLGQVAKVLINENYNTGTHHVKLNASDLASGVYFYKLVSGNFVDVKKLVLMK
jgi:hypothetical protein